MCPCEISASTSSAHSYFIGVPDLRFVMDNNNNKAIDTNDVLFSQWHRHTRKNEIPVLLPGVEPMTFWLIVRMLYHWATGDSWELPCMKLLL